MLFRVGLTREIIESAVFTVDAKDEEEAEDMAWKLAEKDMGEWMVEDEEIDTEFVEEIEDE